MRGRRVGALVCGLRYGEMPFSSDDLELVRTLLDQASLAIENAHLLDRLQTQLEEVRELKQYTESIIEASPAGIAVLDAEGRIQSANLAFAALAGADPDALKRQRLLDVLPLERVPAPGDGLLELGIVDGRGRERSIQASVAPFSSARGAGAVLVVNDVTERMAMERKLEEKERLASLGIMAAGIAHEVNTPITGISSYAQMLLDATPSEDPRYPLLKKVERQTFRASRIVNSLLKLARNQDVEATPIDVSELVSECLELLRDRTEALGIKVEMSTSDGDDDRRRLRRRAPAGVHQPLLERDRGDARRRHAARRDPAERRRRPLDRGRHRRHRIGDRSGGARARVRAVLFHQVARRRHRPRPVDQPRDRASPWWRARDRGPS